MADPDSGDNIPVGLRPSVEEFRKCDHKTSLALIWMELKRQGDVQDTMKETIEGKLGVPGIATRLDRLEQGAKFLYAMGTAVAGMMAKMLYDWVKGK